MRPHPAFHCQRSDRKQTFHTRARDTVEVVRVVVNKRELNSLGGNLSVCSYFLEACVDAEKACEYLQIKRNKLPFVL